MKRTKKGFTLIELIVSMVIASIMIVFFFMALSYALRGFMRSAGDAEMAQKSRASITRAHIELMEMTQPDPSPPGSINEDNFYFIDHNGDASSLRRVGDSVLLNGHVLIDGLGTYSGGRGLLTYRKNAGGTAWTSSDSFDELYAIDLYLVLSGQPGDADYTYTTTVNPRLTTLPNAPRLK